MRLVRLEVVRLEVVRVEVVRLEVVRLKVVRVVVFVVFGVDFVLVLLMVVFEEVLTVVRGDNLIGLVVTMARFTNAATCSSGSPSKTVTMSVESTLVSSTGEMGNAATVRRNEERIRLVNFMFRFFNFGCLACSSPVRQGL